MMNKRYLSVVLTLLGAIAGFPAMAEAAGSRARNSVLAENVCVGESRTSYAQHAMEAKILAYQVLTEEALSLRASAIAFLDEFKEKEARGLPLSGADLRRLNQGVAALLDQRQDLLKAAAAHECWLDDPVPANAEAARAQATGIAMSLSAALILYDNYLSAIGIYRANSFLRQHLNRQDKGFAINAGELNRIAASFSSAINRARVRRGLSWYEKNGRALSDSGNQGERYLAALIEQSPAYNMVRRVRPIGYAENLMGFFGVLSVDKLNQLKSEGVNFSSMVFGNAIGLVETRRGKLDGKPEVLERVAGAVQAGDILLEKTPFRLSDAFIPGHWGHAAIWVGSEDELRRLGIWNHPVVLPHQGRIRAGRGVVEALRAGVKMNSLAHFLNVDDLAVLHREGASDEARVEVILQALRQVGKAYDFNFDAESTDRIVCSELIYHAYGDIRWPTARHLGRVTISPDNVAVEATDTGPLSLSLLYHNGQEVVTEPRRYLGTLLKAEVVKVARGS